MKLFIIFLGFLFSHMGLAQPAASEDFFNIAFTKISECKEAFDIEPYFLIAIGTSLDSETDPRIFESLDQYFQSGHLPLTEAQQGNPEAKLCATYAEGLLMGSLGFRLTDAIKDALSEIINSAIGEALDPN